VATTRAICTETLTGTGRYQPDNHNLSGRTDMNKVISVAAATALGLGLMATSPAAQAAPASNTLPSVDALAAAVPGVDYAQYRGRRHAQRHGYRGNRARNAAGAAAAVGIAGALIGGAIAAQHARRDYYDQLYGSYGGPAYGGYYEDAPY
jgi:hypothetical protein